MRHILVALLFVLVLCFAGSSSGGPVATHVDVAIGQGYAAPEEGYDGHPVGETDWEVHADFAVRAPGCSHLSVAQDAKSFYDGNRLHESAGGLVTDAWGSSFSSRVDAHGYPGHRVSVRVTATCTAGQARGATGRTTRWFQIPAASCNGGPVRVLAIQGNARREDDNAEAKWEPLLAGDFVGTQFGTVRVARRGRVVLGAPECNRFVATLYPGETHVAGYSQFGEAGAFRARHIRVTEDARAGGVAVWENPFVWVGAAPVRCRDCGGPPVADYEVLRAGRHAVVRVYDGVVAVHGLSPRVWIGSSHEAYLICTARGCLTTRPRPWRIWQPLRPRAVQPRRLARTLAGPRIPSRKLLAPAGSRVAVKRVDARRREPSLVVASWSRPIRGDALVEGGVVVWVLKGRTWQRVSSVRPRFDRLGVRIGDVTHDRHADVFLDDETGGSGGCKTTTVLATVHASLRRVFRRDFCERGNATARRGDLVVVEDVGACPAGSYIHCSGGTARSRLRWTGQRFVRISRFVHCDVPGRDPRRNCFPRQRTAR